MTRAQHEQPAAPELCSCCTLRGCCLAESNRGTMLACLTSGLESDSLIFSSLLNTATDTRTLYLNFYQAFGTCEHIRI